MANMNWKQLQQPLFRWASSVERIICAQKLPEFSGTDILIASDYSGSHISSKYQVISALYVDLNTIQQWETNRKAIRQQFLPDGRRLSFKALNDKKRRKILIPFLQIADLLPALSLTVAIKKNIGNLCFREEELAQAKKSFGLECQWRHKHLETAMRVAHLISILVAGLSAPKQNIYWISDEDELFANPARSGDLQRILGKFTGHYIKHELGELGIGTTSIDEGDRLEEDLTAIPDLIAGAVSEIATRLCEIAGGRITPTIAIPVYERFSPKTEIINSWMWSTGSILKRIVIIFDSYGKNGMTIFNLGQME
ncbi:MAG: hypothetical protein JST85_30215 [Acidobacteria bacterium]|nr:hypothetical protein [Acidobacteriota bacterium]